MPANDVTSIAHIEVDVWVILRRHSPNAFELAAANADDRHPNFIVKLRIICKTYHGDRSIGSFSRHGRGWKLMHRLVYRRLNRGDAVLDRLLHLLEGARLDLAHALARHAELVG